MDKVKGEFKRVLALMAVLMDPCGRKAFRKWRPFSVTSFRIMRRLMNLNIQFETIVDGGANIGQFARAAVETFPKAKIYCFEPLPEALEKLNNNLSGDPRIRTFGEALGAKNGETLFYRNYHSHSSSVLRLHPKHGDVFPATNNKSLARFKVPMTTLDAALREVKMKSPILLKLDLQGFELEALRGSVKTLRKVKAIILEAAFAPLYEGEASFSEIEDFLRSHGFRFIRPVDFLEDGHGNIAQMDALFLKEGRAQ